jgi:hypothetical protein
MLYYKVQTSHSTYVINNKSSVSKINDMSLIGLIVKAAKKNTFSRNEMLRKYSEKEDLSV